MRELRPGLWHWRAPHPDWTPEERWPREVSSYAVDDGARLLLFDPLAVPSEVLQRAANREPVIVLTAPWHERDSQSLVERLGAAVYAPRPDTADDLVRKFGITAEDAAGGSPDLAWLLARNSNDTHLYAATDKLPIGIEVFLGREENDVVLWVESFGALIPGDTLVDFGHGFQINDSLRGGATRNDVIDRLRPLLALPIQFVLPTHGAPTDRAALERALSVAG